MGVEAFKVIVGQENYGSGTAGANTFKELTKAEAEAIHGAFKEKVIIKGPIEDVQVVEIEAENAEQAAVAAKYVLRAEQPVKNFITIKAANYTETSPK